MKLLFELGSEHVEAINAISGDRCAPHPHTFADRLLRPGDQAFFDIIHAFNGYRTCYYRTFAVGYATPAQTDAYRRCREWLDLAIDRVRPASRPTRSPRSGRGEGDRPARRARGVRPPVRPRPGRRPLRVADDLAPALLHGPDRRSSRGWCSRSRPTARRATAARRRGSRRRSSSPRTGREVLTRFPADELLVAGRNYVRGADFPAPPTATGSRPRRRRDASAVADVASRTLITGGTVITVDPQLGDLATRRGADRGSDDRRRRRGPRREDAAVIDATDCLVLRA